MEDKTKETNTQDRKPIFKKVGEPLEYKTVTLPNLVAFPDMPIRQDIHDSHNKKVIEKAYEKEEDIIVAYQRNFDLDNLQKRNFNAIAVVAKIKQVIKPGPNAVKLIAMGKKRVHIEKIVKTSPYLTVKAVPVEEKNSDTVVAKALFSKAKEK
ncbi:MAG: LON peptidase substrate-binding domain-containing protein, partial [Candidatus Woesearchaeota archaeon]